MREYFRHKWVTMVPWSRKQRILDVGCGRGDLLRSMQYAGFKDLTGIDPFLPQEISENGFHLYRKTMEELEGKYDVIVSCHSLEHLSDQHSAMRSLKRLLAPNGYLAITIPMYNEYFLRKYGNAWCSWSIPHHFYLHSMESFQKLLSANNLQIEKHIQSTHISYVYDSERYLAMLSDDPLVKKRFAETSMAEWKREMWRVIRAGNGDCGLFLIRHKN
ncbi:MAG: class I SAM-dependent methyltransferase [Planctomycetia bacterium]|nr:class I SAM-dependent methyltransferase [Planctomycetia bacterium]